MGTIVQNLQTWRENRKLPDWVEWVPGHDAADRGKPHLTEGFYEVDPHIAYPRFITKLGLPMTQSSLEIARRCVTEYLFELLGKKPLTMVIKRDERYALKNFPEGDGAAAGSAVFRRYYRAVAPNKT